MEIRLLKEKGAGICGADKDFRVKQAWLLSLMCMQVVVVPGRIFHVQGLDPAFKCPFARLAFCNQSDANLWEGAKRLGTVLRACQSQSTRASS
jgi:DNA-binding transcriptional MocR family regulator